MSDVKAAEPSEKTAPYCPTATLLMVVRYYRKVDVPPAISKERLTQLGVTDALLNRTWQALVFFGFIDKDGKTGETLKSIRYSTDENYPTVLGAILQKAYADIFSVIGDPATITEARLNAAFTPYSPGGQRDRMKLLFIGLCQEAQIPLAVTRNQRSTQADAGAGPKAPRASRSSTFRPKVVTRGGASNTNRATRLNADGEDAALVAWFNKRPALTEPWPNPARERWSKTLMAIIDGLYDQDPWTTTDDGEEEGEGGGE